MAEATTEFISQSIPQPAQSDMPPLPPPNESSGGGEKPPLPTTLSNAQNLIDTALASRKLSVKENPTLQMKWEQMYSRLLAYKETHGNCLVPNRYKEDRSLGQWVSAQRRQFKQLQNGEDSPMTKERAAMLEGIGFVWATLERGHVPWEVRYQELMAYKLKHGDCLVPIGFKENPQLSSWVSTQRQEMKLLKEGRPTRLTEDRIHLLNDGGFVWESQRGKRGGRKKKRQPTDQGGKVEALSSSMGLSHARPSMMAARVITDSDSSLPPLLSSSGADLAPLAFERAVTDPGQFDDADGGGAIVKKRKTTPASSSLPAPTPYSVPSALPCLQGSDGIFDDADEDEDHHTAAAVDTYFKAQRKRPSTSNFSHMSETTVANRGSSLERMSNVPLAPPPRLAHRKVTCCDSKPGAETSAPKNNSQEQSQQEAAVALLSVGRAMA
uniref:Helicase-associated domain-containing protein n=1 Tax=Odontella aurita TaxID=265563 RepID=A0A7S4M8C4_9STRA|mmetsp:Transcript_13682/g.39977  ORF Transcript_13682/g.39977 Transcript_13682/m.39977 type:complete len:439 (+) Transcript_13682:749-2065(+)|eukprot:CAMPEP_0113550256 /NCGR_PEP_ID=MMETSP0015_2-20120614/13885_1 /TAXON_ID=2838 /ORGANISM="Odontella" /LENGTH=438 /DNA_ID=CAMNT_0000451051 /DNA_START=682 /DNA_END=1998 /DNA_ORIENTATION=- /assembly_acc=CAM_ASM_000160